MANFGELLMSLLARVQVVALFLTVLVGSATAFWVVYQLFFHPLAKYPGPFLAKFTNLYAAYHAWTGDIHLDIYRSHLKYGDHVRYAPNRVIFDTSQALQDIYSHKGKVIKYSNYDILSRQAPNLLTIRDKAVHGSRRRVVSQAFSESSLRIYEPKIQSRIDRFCQALKCRTDLSKSTASTPALEKGQSSGPLDMAHRFNHLAFDIMTAVSFDSDFDAIGAPEYRFVVEAIEASNVRLGVLLQSAELTWRKLDKKLFPHAIAGRHRFVKFIRTVLAKRLGGNKSSSQDIFSFLETCKDPETGRELTTAELSTETATFIVAGADTSSSSMAAVAHYLTGSSASYRAVAKEIRDTFSSREDICLGGKLNSCGYLRACLDEALRMSPPGGAALWREVEKGGALIDGHFIPGGCEVAVGIYSLQHSAKYYDEPFKFDPGRWYRPEGTKKGAVSERSPYMPFSIGPRSCVGKPLAVANIMLVFARIFYEFDFCRDGQPPNWFEQADTQPSEYTLKDHVTAWKEGPVLRFTPRA